VPFEAELSQRFEDGGAAPRDFARRIEVFDAHQPLPVGVFGRQVAADGSHQRTKMEPAGG
jgi:hypothetical protein